jgi:isocitrate lyase
VQLGGLHSNAYISDLFARAFSKEGMKAYVELIQRKERELGTDVLTHQRVSQTICLHEYPHPDPIYSGAEQTMLTTSSKR